MADSGKGHGFFAVDRRTWARVCGLGLNAAVAYLVLARGTGRNNRETAWSVLAVENYTGIARGRARDAIQLLMKDGVVRKLRDGTHPKYELIPWHLVPDSETRNPLGRYEQKILDKIAKGEKITAPADRARAERAVAERWLITTGDGQYSIAPRPDTDPDWIWLPNEIITSAASETPPIELVRQVQDVMILRLLIDYYHAQNLCDDGGISRKFTYRRYKRSCFGEQAQYVVWGFQYANEVVCWGGPTLCHRREELTQEEKAAGKNAAVDFFHRQQRLNDLGLLQWVPHLCEGDGPDAEIIHPVGVDGSDDLEDRIGEAAHEAGLALLNEGQRGAAYDAQLVPVLQHRQNVQMVGIARLRYRPHTRMTAAWWHQLNENGEKYLAEYNALTNRSR
jgi:hypothetical protein